jgi:uncharacterized protein
MRWLRWMAIVGLVGYGAIAALMFALQRELLYRPDAARVAPAAVGLPMVSEETVTTPDGERLVAWWVAPQDATQPVVLYLHGNGANLSARARRFERLIADGSGLLAVSWRGYGGSTGKPSEAGLRIDAEAAYRLLADRVEPGRIILFGESLGTALATGLAADKPAAGLVLDSAFPSILALAQRSYPWLPVQWLLIDRFRADLDAPKVTVPVLMAHCVSDPITPLAMAEAQRARFKVAPPIAIHEDQCHPVPFPRIEEAYRGFLASLGFP